MTGPLKGRLVVELPDGRTASQYDGVEDNYIGTTWDVLLDETRGRIAMVELEDVLKRFDGKRVRITIEEVHPQRPALRGEGSTTP